MLPPQSPAAGRRPELAARFAKLPRAAAFRRQKAGDLLPQAADDPGADRPGAAGIRNGNR